MRVNNPLFSLLLALPLIAAGCGGSVAGSGSGSGNGNGSNSTGANGFTVVSVSVAQSQIWQINRAIDIRFTRAVDFSTVGLNTISIATPSGLSATGVFTQVDADTVRFQPACPTLADNSDAGFLPGGRTYTLHVLDTSVNGVTVRDTQGYGVYQGLVVTFQTPTPSIPRLCSSIRFLALPMCECATEEPCPPPIWTRPTLSVAMVRGSISTSSSAPRRES